jgi:hypothetical protein
MLPAYTPLEFWIMVGVVLNLGGGYFHYIISWTRIMSLRRIRTELNYDVTTKKACSHCRKRETLLSSRSQLRERFPTFLRIQLGQILEPRSLLQNRKRKVVYINRIVTTASWWQILKHRETWDPQRTNFTLHTPPVYKSKCFAFCLGCVPRFTYFSEGNAFVFVSIINSRVTEKQM